MALAFHHSHDIKLNTQKHGAYHNLKQPCSTTSPLESYLLSQMAVIYWQDGLHISLHLPNMSYLAHCWTINIVSSLAKYGWIFCHPFCCGVSFTMKCLSMPSSRHNCRNRLLLYSLPLSDLNISIFLHVCSFILLLHSTKIP